MIDFVEILIEVRKLTTIQKMKFMASSLMPAVLTLVTNDLSRRSLAS